MSLCPLSCAQYGKGPIFRVEEREIVVKDKIWIDGSDSHD